MLLALPCFRLMMTIPDNTKILPKINLISSFSSNNKILNNTPNNGVKKENTPNRDAR